MGTGGVVFEGGFRNGFENGSITRSQAFNSGDDCRNYVAIEVVANVGMMVLRNKVTTADSAADSADDYGDSVQQEGNRTTLAALIL